MDKDRVKGAIDDAAGRVKRQVGEWTGDTGTQVEGAAQQVKGKAEKAWGTVKDAAGMPQTKLSVPRRSSQKDEPKKNIQNGTTPSKATVSSLQVTDSKTIRRLTRFCASTAILVILRRTSLIRVNLPPLRLFDSARYLRRPHCTPV